MDVNTSAKRIGNRYLLLEEIGEGGMGVVYRAKDRLTGHEVALKRVLTNLDELNLEDTLQIENFRLGLAREFKLSASLRHPNIVDVLDYGFDDDKQPYYTMELLQSPQTIVEAARPLTIAGRVSLIMQMLHALMYLHRRGIVHRDLKPGNVQVVENRVKVLDFGLSIMHERASQEDASDTTVGTLAYMAPEVLTGETGDIVADLYAVGMMSYEMIAGEHPFDVDNPTTLINEILWDTPSVDNLDISVELAAVIANLLQKDPQLRYQSAQETLDALQNATHTSNRIDTSAIRDSFLQAARFVGRDDELKQLVTALQATFMGKSSAWLIAGESGVGKSRIIDELRTQAMVNGALVMRGQAVSVGSRPYEMWQTALRWLCLLDEYLSDDDIALLKLFVPDADKLILRDTSTISPASLPPEEIQTQMLQLFNRVLQLLNHPVVMLFEDLHWAGSESLQAMSQWTETANGLPIMTIGSYRDDEKPNLHEQFVNAKSLKLGRLDDDGIAELSAAMLGDVGRTQQVVDLLRRESEGNVFFIIEVVRALADTVGNLDEIGHMTLPARVFAGGVQSVVRRRLDKLNEQSRALLRYAAVMGRELQLDVLAQIMPKMRLNDWIADCVNAAVLEVNDEVYRFAHDKLRVALLELTDSNQQRELHRTVAAMLETLHGDDANSTVITALAHHWGNANVPEKEERYVTLAGEQSLKIGAYHEAVNYFTRAMSVVENLSISEKQKKQKLIYLKQHSGEAHLGFADYENAKMLYEESLELSRALDSKVSIAVSLECLGNVAFAVENYVEAKNLYEQALTLYRDLDNQAGIAKILNRLGDVSYEQGEQEQAKQLYQQSLQISREIGEDWGMAGAVLNQQEQASTGTSVDNLIALLKANQMQSDTQAVLNTLLRIALVYRAEAQGEKALEILAFLLYYDETAEDIIDEAEPVIYALQEGLDIAVSQQAWEQGKNSTLEDILSKLLP